MKGEIQSRPYTKEGQANYDKIFRSTKREKATGPSSRESSLTQRLLETAKNLVTRTK